MKLRKTILIGVAAILFLQKQSFCQTNQPTAAIDTNSIIQTIKTFGANLAANPPLSTEDYTKKVADLMGAYRQEKIDKGVVMAETLILEHNHAQNIYGKVIDQNGQPVAGVDVTGGVMIFDWNTPDGERPEKYKTQTDTNGLFEFTGLRGSDWFVNVAMEGYEMNYRVGWSGPRGGPHGTQSSPTNRAVLTMWKLRGAEPMVHTEIQAGLACDGIPRSFNLLTGQKLPSGGDLVATLIRNPVDIDRRKHFDWNLTLSVPEGGLIERNGGYANEAPEKGYQQTITIGMPANTNNWTPSIRRDFFFKSREGQDYGIMTIDLMANYEPPPTHFEIGAYVNPAGSRNLEIDPKKVTAAHP